MTVSALLVSACADTSVPAAPEIPASVRPPASRWPVVEVVPAAVGPPLDPSADPRTPLGELRARYLPLWSSDFDWAFPPEVCGSDWALDAVAEPTAEADPGVLGDAAAAAALSVMRSEYLLSRAAAEPSLLAQLCVAVATVGPARSHSLDRLAAHLRDGTRSTQPAGYPDEVVVVAAGPRLLLAVACLTPGYPRVTTATGEVLEDPPAPARLGAYLLTISRGLEDAVVDISYRVTDVEDRPTEDCDGLDAWVADWDRQVTDWVVAGEIWGAVGRRITSEGLCDSPPPDGPDECPRDWSS